jgi:O-antigen/teichoic acid export membrane protein
MTIDGPTGVDQSSARRRRTSTRLLLFAGSSWARIFATFLVTVYLTRLLMGELGAVLAGLFYMFSFMTRFIVPLRGALSQVMTREAAAALTAGDRERVRRVFSNAVVLSGALSLVALLAMGSLAPFVAQIFEVPDRFVEFCQIAVVCEALIAASVLFFNPWVNMYLATQRIVAENVARTTERLLDLFAAMLAFWVLPGLGVFAGVHIFVLFVVMRMVLRVSQQFVRAVIIHWLVSSARVRLAMVNRKEMREIGAVGGWSLSNAAANMSFYAADQPFVNVFFGPVYNAIFAIVTRLQGMGQLLGGNLSFGVQAMAADYHELGKHELNRRILLTSMRLTSTISAMCTAGVVLLCVPIVDVWLGSVLRADEELMAAMPYERVLYLIAGFTTVLIPSVWFSQAMLTSTKVLYGMGLIRRYSPQMLIAACAKLLLAWVGLRFFGAGPMWIVWSTVIAQVWCFGYAFPALITEVFSMRHRDLFMEVYGRPLMAIALPTAGLYTITRLVNDWDLARLLLAIMVGGVLFVPGFYLIALDGHERARLTELIVSVRTNGPRVLLNRGKKKRKR